MLRSCEAISQASSSACSCCVITERHMSRRRATFCGAPFVSVIGPLEVELGEYELEEPFGRLVESGRATDRVYVPLAHTEGSLSASLYRGARAVSESGGFKTFVLGDRITRASCFVCGSAEEAVMLARFLDAHVAEMRRWLAERVEAEPTLSKYAKLREVDADVVGSMCHVMWAFTTGDALGPV